MVHLNMFCSTGMLYILACMSIAIAVSNAVHVKKIVPALRVSVNSVMRAGGCPFAGHAAESLNFTEPQGTTSSALSQYISSTANLLPQSLAQTFLSPPTGASLASIAFTFLSANFLGEVTFAGYVYEWDVAADGPVGQAIFASPPAVSTAPPPPAGGAYITVFNSTTCAALAANTTYAAILSTAGYFTANQRLDLVSIAQGIDPYPNGNLFIASGGAISNDTQHFTSTTWAPYSSSRVEDIAFAVTYL